MTQVQNIDSVTFTPKNGTVFNITSLVNLDDNPQCEVTLLQTDKARTISAAFADGIHHVVTITVTDDEFAKMKTKIYPGITGKLTYKENRKADGGAASATNQLSAEFKNVMCLPFTSGIPCKGSSTTVLSFVAYDPDGISCVTYSGTA